MTHAIKRKRLPRYTHLTKKEYAKLHHYLRLHGMSERSEGSKLIDRGEAYLKPECIPFFADRRFARDFYEDFINGLISWPVNDATGYAEIRYSYKMIPENHFMSELLNCKKYRNFRTLPDKARSLFEKAIRIWETRVRVHFIHDDKNPNLFLNIADLPRDLMGMVDHRTNTNMTHYAFANIVFSSHMRWRKIFARLSLIIHELGHVLGLPDFPRSMHVTVKDSVMGDNVERGAYHIKQLTPTSFDATLARYGLPDPPTTETARLILPRGNRRSKTKIKIEDPRIKVRQTKKHTEFRFPSNLMLNLYALTRKREREVTLLPTLKVKEKFDSNKYEPKINHQAIFENDKEILVLLQTSSARTRYSNEFNIYLTLITSLVNTGKTLQTLCLNFLSMNLNFLHKLLFEGNGSSNQNKINTHVAIKNSADEIPYDTSSLDPKIKLHTETQEPIFVYRAYKNGHDVGSASFYKHPILCRDKTGERHNIIETSGIFTQFYVNPKTLEEVCDSLPPTLFDSVIATAMRGAKHGALRGTANLVDNILQAKKIPEQMANFICKLGYFMGYFLLQYYDYKNQHELNTWSNIATAALKAVYNTGFIFLITFTLNIFAKLIDSLSQKLKQNDWVKTGRAFSFFGKHLSHGVYVYDAVNRGLLSESVSVVAGMGTQLSIEAMGNLLIRKF